MSEIFESRHKVRPYECDFYGHVNNAIYLNFLEFARMEVLESRGLDLRTLKEMGFMIVLSAVEMTYRQPATAYDHIVIRTELARYSGVRGTFAHEIIREADGALLLVASVTWVTVDLNGRPLRIPPVIRNAFQLD